MNLSEFQTNVNYRRRDTSSSFISTDEIKEYVNEALRKITLENEWEWQKTSTTFSFTTGGAYAISSVASDMKMPISVFYTDDYQFNQVTPDDFYRLSSNSNDIYAVDGQSFLVNTGAGSVTLTLNYYSFYGAQTSGSSWIEKLSATTDEPLMPERFQDTLTDYAAARCYMKEGMSADYKMAMESYYLGLEKMKREYPSRRSKALKRFRSINEFETRNVYYDKSNPLRQ